MGLLNRSRTPAPAAESVVPATEPAEAPPLHHQFGTVHELDADFLRYFAERHGDEYGPALDGKFVRVHEMILLAPLKTGYGNNKSHVYHPDMVRMGEKSRNDAFVERLIGAKAIQGTSTANTLKHNGLADAGSFEFELDDDGNITSFDIYGWSNSFGNPEQADRAKTLEIAQKVLGQKVKVTELDPDETIKRMIRRS